MTTPQKTYIIDFDSTLVTTESLDDLAKIALRHADNRDGIVAEINAITDLGMNGTITFQEALARRLALFSPTQSMIDELISDLVKQISPSALEKKEWFSENRDHIYVVSGGFDDYIVPVVELLGIPKDHVHANKFVFENGVFISHDVTRHTAKAGGKATQVKNLPTIGEIVVIGDGYTDYEIKKNGVANHFWAFTETVIRDNVTKHADKILRSFHDV